jgi:hypothetical protein
LQVSNLSSLAELPGFSVLGENIPCLSIIENMKIARPVPPVKVCMTAALTVLPEKIAPCLEPSTGYIQACPGYFSKPME